MNVRNRWVLGGVPVMVVGLAVCAAAWAVDESQSDEQIGPTESAKPYGAVIRGDAESDTRDTGGGTPENKQVSDPALDEILEIRRQLGENPFRGTIFDRVPRASEGASGRRDVNSEGEFNRAFSDALKAVAADAAERRPVVEPVPKIRAPFSQGSVDTDFVGSLRQAARALDNKAAELEPLRQYDSADQLRRLANKLRRQAREHDGTSQGVDR